MAVVCLVGLGSQAYATAEIATASAKELADLTAPILWWTWTGTFAKFGSVIFALTCAPACLHSYSAMGQRNIRYVYVCSWGGRFDLSSCIR